MRDVKRLSPALLVASLSFLAQVSFASAAYRDDILADKPVAVWDFNDTTKDQVASAVSSSGPAIIHGKLSPTAGPRPSSYPAFGKENNAVAITPGAWLRVSDPGEKSALDFDLGDTITLEAWVMHERDQ